MALNTILEKLRLLAQQDAGVAAFLGSGPFRWFATQLQPGYAKVGPCVTATFVSAAYIYGQQGQVSIEQARIQFDCISQDETTAAQLLGAVNNFVQNVDLMTPNEFTSPPSSGTVFANFKLLQRGPSPLVAQSLQLWVWTADWRIWNNTQIT